MPRSLAILRLDDPAPHPPPLNMFSCNGVSPSLRGCPPTSHPPLCSSFMCVCVCVCLHACCTHRSVISHTHSPLVAGDWFNIPLGNLCKTNSLQEWKGLEEGRKKGREAGREWGGGWEKKQRGRNLWWNNYPQCHCGNILWSWRQ